MEKQINKDKKNSPRVITDRKTKNAMTTRTPKPGSLGKQKERPKAGNIGKNNARGYE